MEKRQLVRTFGSALAAATLSFGLFAAPAIAEMSVVANGEAEAYVEGTPGNPIKVGEVELDQTATIWVPVDVKEMDVTPDTAEMTFSKDGRRKSQDIVVTADGTSTGVYFYDDVNSNTTYTDKAQIKNLKKAWLKFQISNVTDLSKVLKGTWTADFVTFKFNDPNEDDVVVDVTGATITANGDAEDAPGFTLEQGSLKVDLATMSSKDANAYRVNYTKDAELEKLKPLAGKAVIEATVVDPSGRQISVSGKKDSSNAENDNGYGNTTSKCVLTPLPSKVEGLYGLESLVAKVPVAKSQDGNVIVYNVDSYNDVTDGIYEVSAGLIIPVYRIYNSFDGQHLYTTDMLEAATRIAEGWTDEGIGWYGAADYWDTSVKNPVYRLYNQWSHDHAYTDSDTERLAMVLDGWTDEGVSFYGLKDGQSLTIGTKSAEAEPVWRLFNQYVTFGTHHYTTSTDEYDALAEAGWTKENIGFNGVKVTQSFVDVQSQN